MTMKHIGSVITTSAKDRSLPTSIPPTETGVAIQLSTAKKERAVARLLEVGNPNTIDKNLVSSLESITGYPVIEKTKVKFIGQSDCDIITTGFKIKIDDLETCNRCLEAVQSSLLPMPMSQIKEQLTLLTTLVVKPAGENGTDVAIRIKAIANQLSEYPADIVQTAIANVAKTTTFWPAFAEFYKHIAWRLSKRQRLLEEITNKKLALIMQNQ